jgi:hypothetical protein
MIDNPLEVCAVRTAEVSSHVILIEMNVDVPLSQLAEAKLKQIPRPFA